MICIEVVADGASLWVNRHTGEVVQAVQHTSRGERAIAAHPQFNPLHPALLMAEPWEEVPLHKLLTPAKAVA